MIPHPVTNEPMRRKWLEGFVAGGLTGRNPMTEDMKVARIPDTGPAPSLCLTLEDARGLL